MRGIDPAATKGRERDASPLPANMEMRTTPGSTSFQGSDAPLAHRRPGYSLSGCVPAEPDAASRGNSTGAIQPGQFNRIVSRCSSQVQLDIGVMPRKIHRRLVLQVGWLLVRDSRMSPEGTVGSALLQMKTSFGADVSAPKSRFEALHPI